MSHPAIAEPSKELQHLQQKAQTIVKIKETHVTQIQNIVINKLSTT